MFKKKKIMENQFNKIFTRINEIGQGFQLLNEVQGCGIFHAAKNRRLEGKDHYKEMLEVAFDDITNREVVIYLMSISFRDIFKNPLDPGIRKIIEDKGMNIKVLLLDPTSLAAYNRALVEEKGNVLDPSVGYINTTLFKTIRDVAYFLAEPDVRKNLKEKIEQQIQVRFYPFDPNTNLIITDKYTITEQYHRGGSDTIKQHILKTYQVDQVTCFGGFVPVFMMNNSPFHSQLLRSHFENIWDSDEVVRRDLRANNYHEFISAFENNYDRLKKIPRYLQRTALTMFEMIKENLVTADQVCEITGYKKDVQEAYLYDLCHKKLGILSKIKKNGQFSYILKEKLNEYHKIKREWPIIRRFDLRNHKEQPPKKFVKFCMVQLGFSMDFRARPPVLKQDIKNKVKDKIFNALALAKTKKVDVICFPEFSFDKDFVDELKSKIDKYGNMIIHLGGDDLGIFGIARRQLKTIDVFQYMVDQEILPVEFKKNIKNLSVDVLIRFLDDCYKLMENKWVVSFGKNGYFFKNN